jgi:hypothetical protein
MKKLFAISVLLTSLLLTACGEEKIPDYTEVAKCLTEKGAVMYGASWCPHCLEQKKAFGDAVKYITYQECDQASEGGDHLKCLQAGVQSYPTWIIPGQSAKAGAYPVADLAKFAGCEDKLPQEVKDQLAALAATETAATATTDTQLTK